MLLRTVFIFCLAKATLAQTLVDSTTYDPFTSSDEPINACCTIDGVRITDIPEGDYFYINETIFDNIKDTVYIPSSGALKLGSCVKSVSIGNNRYVTLYQSRYDEMQLRVRPIHESIEISHPAEHYYYNFTLSLKCDGSQYTLYTKIPIHETNTYTPVFAKTVYQYTLFSPFDRDLQRLIELNPIIANDNDISSTELLFSISNNKYFDIQYEGVVPNTLNKNHSAILVPKVPNTELPQQLELTIYVTDLGFPSKSSNATLRISPSQASIYPVFKQPYYIGDYFLNNTFRMRQPPQFEAIEGNYFVNAGLSGSLYQNYFTLSFYGNGTVNLQKYSYNNLPELAIYKYGYLVYTLTVTFTDKINSNLQTKGSATIIVELHSA